MRAERDTIVVVTGAAGRVATAILDFLRREFRLRLVDLEPVAAKGDDEVFVADVRDIDAVTAVSDGAGAVIHLAAQPSEADFRDVLLPRNVDGTWAVFEAARVAGVSRLVFASTIQTVDGYPLDARVDADMPPRPVTVYGCTKLFGDALGRFYADTTEMRVACLRLGGVVDATSPRLTEPRFRTLWCDPDDLARLVVAAVKSDVRFATVIAVSPPATQRFDTSNPFGWTPVGTPTP